MFTTYSAANTSFKTPGGKELQLAFQNKDNYLHPTNPCFGASVGRVANRIYGAEIEIAGKKWPLAVNQQPDITLHGGPTGWNRREWEGPFVTTEGSKTRTEFRINSPHLDNGFPGEVNASVVYTTYTENGKNYMEVEYEARLADNSPVDETVVSLTNHSAFNVTGDSQSFEGTQIKIFTNKWIEQDKTRNGAPTGRLTKFPAVPEDLSFFRLSKEHGPAIDDAFMFDPEHEPLLDTRSRELLPNVHLYSADTKANLKVYSTEPMFQVYTGEFMNTPQLPGEPHGFPKRCGVAIEPARPTHAQAFDKWRPWVLLKKGQVYGSRIVYEAWDGELVEY